MEPAIIATAVVTALSPLIKKGAEAFMAEVGRKVFDHTKSLWRKLQEKWKGNAVEMDLLGRFETKPETYKAPLQDMLAEALEADPDFAKTLADRIDAIKQAGPELDIVMEIETAEAAVTGLEAGEMRGGRASVRQKITNAKGPVTGAKIDSIK
jgi:hypothetical protein